MAKRRDSSNTAKKEPGLSDPSTGSSGSSPLLSPAVLGSAPTPKAAEAEAKKTKPVAAKAKADPKPVVTLRVFQTLSGVKPAQFAGFMRFALSEEMRPATIPDWRARYKSFLNRPTK